MLAITVSLTTALLGARPSPLAHGAAGAYDELITLGLGAVLVVVALWLGRGKPKK